MSRQKVVIIGGGPAGLSCAFELVKFGDRFDVTVLEKESSLGGISKTIQNNGYFFDLGGHRFFTKSDIVNTVWHEVLKEDFLKRSRLSRIYYKNRFFNYPLKPLNALFGLGIMESFYIVSSYFYSRVRPYSQENTFEEWVSNRFGKRLYEIFFKTYTEKVWGIPCSDIRAEWAGQRIKGLSLRVAVLNALFSGQKNKVKTLIHEFEYPKYGPGMMWDAMAKIIRGKGGKVIVNADVDGLRFNNSAYIQDVHIKTPDGESILPADHVVSSMPLIEFAGESFSKVPFDVKDAVNRLKYRGLITVALIIGIKDMFPDNWIYVHSPEVLLGRIQNFKNWSPYMVPDNNMTCLGLEYFCSQGDTLWNMSDDDLIKLGTNELFKIGLLHDINYVERGIVIRTDKAYPVYDQTYQGSLKKIKDYLGSIKNLQTIGRNGMHRYNNMDHSMLTGIYAARNIACCEKHDIWKINLEEEYHEAG